MSVTPFAEMCFSIKAVENKPVDADNKNLKTSQAAVFGGNSQHNYSKCSCSINNYRMTILPAFPVGCWSWPVARLTQRESEDV